MRLPLFCLALAGFCVTSAFAQEAYPLKPVRVVIPFPPGGTVDFFARALGAKIAEITGGGMTLDTPSGQGPKPPADAAGGNDVRAILELALEASPDGFFVPAHLVIHPSQRIFGTCALRREFDSVLNATRGFAAEISTPSYAPV